MAAQEPNTSTGRDVRALRLVCDGLTSAQEPPKGLPYATALDAPRVAPETVPAEPVYCSRPAGGAGLWRCALPFSHIGDHVPMGRPDLLVDEVIRLREERESARSLLRTAGKLLRSIEPYGNPGHSFRQDLADRIEKHVAGAR